MKYQKGRWEARCAAEGEVYWWKALAERLEKSSGELSQGAQSEKMHKTPDPRPHYVELDALRGIAGLAVLMAHIALSWLYIQSHLSVPSFQMKVLEFFEYLGFFMNVLFFMLSGYLLTWTEEGRRKRQGGSYSVLNYAKRRALRIVPAYYVALALLVLVGPVTPSFGTVAVHLTFLHGFFFIPQIEAGPFWTLTVEVAFYAMLPLLVLKFRRFSQRAMIFGVLLLASVITRLVMVGALDFLPVLGELRGGGLASYPTTWLYLCLGGVLIRMMVERYANIGSEPSRRQLSVTSALTVVSVALLLVLTLLIFPYLGMKPLIFVRTPAGMILEALAILVFVSAVLGSPILKPVLKLRPLGFVGKISYSLYLLHGLVLAAVATYVLPVVLWFTDQGSLTIWAAFVTYAFVVVAVAVAIAYLSFRYIESPFMRIKPK